MGGLLPGFSSFPHAKLEATGTNAEVGIHMTRGDGLAGRVTTIESLIEEMALTR